MTLVWLSHPVLWHSSRVPSYNFSAMTTEQAELVVKKWHFWYEADYDYGRTTVYFFCVGIALFGLFNLFFRLRQRASTAETIRPLPGYGLLVAASRSLGARQLRIPALRYYSPPLSAVVIVLTMIVFFCVLMFAARPYTWPSMAMGHSPPIATHGGWVSIAIMPFLFAFATKFNLVGMVTGVSHEKLQVLHRWSAWIMYIASLIHTFPFIVQSIRLHEMTNKWNTTLYYWSGVAALVPQTWLVFMSIGRIRNRYYETFKKLHFIASGIFMAFLFVHCNFRLTSWDYFWATAGVYGFSWLARVIRTFLNRTAKATVEALPENMIKVTIPTKVSWRPGQHFFVRFLDLGIHAATSHPFTVATLCEDKTGEHVIELYARVHGGITACLGTVAEQGSSKVSTVSLDGPYGGMEGNMHVYDRALLLGGGSGVTFVIPLLLDLVRSFEAGKTACTRVHVVWAVRTQAALAWFEYTLARALADAPAGLAVSVAYYVTDADAKIIKSDEKSGEEDEEDAMTRHWGRPDLPALVKAYCAEPGTVAVATCGPESFNFDVGKAVSDCELEILGGRSACTEIYMHHESYAW